MTEHVFTLRFAISGETEEEALAALERGLEYLTENPGIDGWRLINAGRAMVVERAAREMSESADPGATFYEGQSPIEDWTLDALGEALDGDPEVATSYLNYAGGRELPNILSLAEWRETRR